MVLPTLKVVLPTSVKYIQNPHRLAQMCLLGDSKSCQLDGDITHC